MAENHSEQEQLDELKRWWRDNGNHVVAGLALGVALVGGWRFWQAYETRRAEEAGALHAELVAAGEARDQEKLNALLERLKADYAGTPYAVQGALAAAQTAVASGELSAARGALEWALANAADEDLNALVRLRLARVQLAAGEAEPALATLAPLTGAEWSALAEELRGDALATLGRDAEARSAYERALAAAGEDVSQAEVLRMKLEALAPTADAAS